jgi:hypothetical protein
VLSSCTAAVIIGVAVADYAQRDAGPPEGEAVTA